ncbi:GH32 C-terminal domain-containing protein, partial [Microvirga sp. 3-52]|nr:GH32 C-terminal domain-containing protein [Microvirga sp. 3-52]
RIYMGWMSNWRYANQVPTEGWRSQMTLPRTLALRHVGDQLLVVQNPVEELDSYFTKVVEFDDVLINSEETKTFAVDKSSVEIVLEIDNHDAKQFGVVLSHTASQKTELVIEAETNRVTLDRKDSGQIEFSENFS